MARKQKQQPSERKNQDVERDQGLGGDSQTEIPAAQRGTRMPEKNNRGDSEQEVPSEREQEEEHEQQRQQQNRDELDEPEK